jgi:putative ABC transport system substrate-binding protein
MIGSDRGSRARLGWLRPGKLSRVACAPDKLGEDVIKRREFIALAGGMAAWPLAARAQQPTVPVIGFLSSRSPGDSPDRVAAFREGLAGIGYREGRNVAIEYRWAEGQYGRLPGLAAELAARRVAVIAAVGGPVSALAAKTAAGTIPLVFIGLGDPVALGLVASLNRPGGNVTGVVPFSGELEAKRLELLRELVPHAKLIGALIKTTSPEAESQARDLQQAAQALGLQLLVLGVDSESDIDAAVAAVVQQRAAALFVAASPFFGSRREQIVALAARHSLPGIYSFRDFAAAGGLISYGTSLAGVYRQVGIYTGRILKGEKPADLPVLQPTTFELVINLKTAKALGLTVPPSLLARADEVIE